MLEKISLAGDLGSGKSTVSALLVDLLGAEYYSTGAIVRAIAEKHGMTVVELNKYMESHPEIDHEIDDGLRRLSDDERRLIIDSRMAWHFTEGTFKVYLSTDVETSAIRIMTANRKGEHSLTLEQTVADTRARRDSEKKRYLEQYGVNIKDLSNYSLIVDTTYATPAEIAECIRASFDAWLSDKDFKRVYISPFRLNYPDTEPDGERMSELSDKLLLGEQIAFPLVFEEDGEFYVKEGHEEALAYSLSDFSLIPAILVGGKKTGEYIRMRNSF